MFWREEEEKGLFLTSEHVDFVTEKRLHQRGNLFFNQKQHSLKNMHKHIFWRIRQAP